MKNFFYGLLLLFSSMSWAQADQYSPAYLELKQTSIDEFAMLWKVPARGVDLRLKLYVNMPDGIEVIDPVRTTFVGTAFVERSRFKRKGGLAGTVISIDGLSTLSTDVLVRIERIDGTTEVARLTPTSPSFQVAGTPKMWDVVKTYLLFGVEHILEGFDHLLFVACLIFIARSWRRILVTITGFTIAHSITLTLAALELVRLPTPPIEAIIALSIVFLAREIALDRRDTLTWHYPIFVSSSFGLLHGFGFASALADIGLPQTEIPSALLAFNVGVEIGQILFVVSILLIVYLLHWIFKLMQVTSKNWFQKIERPIAYSVGSIAMFWTIERVAGFGG